MKIDHLIFVFTVSLGLTAESEPREPAQSQVSSPSKTASKDREELQKVLDEFERDLDARISKLPQLPPERGKEQFAIVSSEVQRFLFERLGNNAVAQRQLVDAIMSVDDREFANYLLRHLILFCAAHNKAKELAAILGKRCPERLFFSGIDDYLVILCSDSLQDGVLVLFDAFDVAEDAKSKTTIVTALRRGFRFAGFDEKDDKKFVDACREWYAKNRHLYKPNPRYADHWKEAAFPYNKEGFFIKREKVNKQGKGTGPDTT